MKNNNKRVLVCTLFIYLLSLLLMAVPVMADEPGYEITNFTTQVVVDENRAFHITETIEVNFSESRQGILRSIPIQGDAETYEIDDVKVLGDPFTKEWDSQHLILRIGQRGVYHEGPKTYTIEYTLKHFQDYYSDGDYIYLNLIGPEWDTNIRRFSGTVTYPSAAEFDRLVVTSGGFGATGNDKNVQSAQNQNTFSFASTKSFSPGESVTVNIRLKEGAFPGAPDFVFPYTIHSADINMALTKEKTLETHVKMELSQSEKQYDKYNQAFFPLTGDSNGYVEGFTLISDTGRILSSIPNDGESSSGLWIYLTSPGAYTLEYSYKTILPMEGSTSLLNFSPSSFSIQEEPLTVPVITSGSLSGASDTAMLELPLLLLGDGPVEKATITLESQVPFGDTSLFVGRMGDNLNTPYESAPGKEGQGQRVLVETNKVLYPGERIVLGATVAPGAFHRPFSPQVFWPILAGLIGAVLVYLFLQAKGRDQKLIPVVAIHPPQGLSSPEAGYVLNKKTSAQHMITILYNWANLGYIQISEVADEDLDSNKKKKKKQEDLVITMVKEIDATRPQYEITLFNQMFARGEDGVVTSKNLENKFYKDIQNAQFSLVNRFNKGEKALYKKNSGYVFLAFLLGALPLVLLSFISAKLNHNLEDIFISLGASFGAYLLFFGLWSTSQKPSTLILCLLILLLNILSIPLWVGVLGLIPVWACLVTIALSTLIAFMAAFLPQRTPYGQEIIQELTGFKTFIEVAEKDRLEALIEEDPAYFYNVLPYAQVFGLTKVWTDKFQNILIPAPEWYVSRDPWDTAFTMVYLSRMQNAMTRFEHAAVSTPQPTQSHGSFSGSGGGGFSGGGFSGGGSGGGGGSSW